MSNSLANFQGVGHPAGHDYEAGSPHLRHSQIRNWIIEELGRLVREQIQRAGAARVLEVGAGHGSFTDHLLAAGAQVTLTEMSPASCTYLQARYEHNPAARVIYDERGDAAGNLAETFDLVVCVSVLHHIPDYLAAIRMWSSLTAPGGSFASFQDPLWYPRRSRAGLAADRGAYLVWRLGRGDLVEGVKTRLRRLRGVYDENNPHDMVEYHVVRQGCDEDAIRSLLADHYERVDVTAYWSTQARALQRLGDRLGAKSTFAVVARNRVGA